MIALFALLLAAAAQASTGDFLGDLFAPGMNSAARARLEQKTYMARHAAGLPFGLRQTRFDAAAPFLAEAGGSWRAALFIDYDGIDSDARFSTGRVLPNRLWDAGFGLSHTRLLGDGHTVGGSISLSSPSERPFGSLRELGANLHFTYKIPQPDGNAWLLYLSISNTRGFLPWIPLPGAAYFFQKGRHLHGLAGVPFLFLHWQPGDAWALTFFYFPFRTGELKLAYGSPRKIQPFALLNHRTKNYLLSDRADPRERLFYEEGTAQAGLSLPVSRSLGLDVSGGQSFGRRYFQSTKVLDRGSAPQIRPDNALFASAKAQASF